MNTAADLPALASVFAAEATPDPLPLASLLRAAVEHARRDGRSQADVARAAGVAPSHLARALKPERETQPSVARRILAACGCRVELVLDDGGKVATG